jgi:hypothetical protein
MQTNEWIVQDMLALERGAMLRIEDGRDMLVYVWKGSVWLTQDGDGRDVLLGAGGWFRLDRKGVAVVYALGRCALTLTSPYQERYAAAVQLLEAGARSPRTLYQRAPRALPSLVQRVRTVLRRAREGLRLPAPDRTAAAL